MSFNLNEEECWGEPTEPSDEAAKEFANEYVSQAEKRRKEMKTCVELKFFHTDNGPVRFFEWGEFKLPNTFCPSWRTVHFSDIICQPDVKIVYKDESYKNENGEITITMWVKKNS